VTWQPEICHTVSYNEYLHCVKFQLFTTSRFGVIRKKVKTWTHLPEKPMSKNKGTRSTLAMSQLWVSAEKYPGGGNRKKKTSNSTPRKPSFISCGILGDALDNCPGLNLKDILHHELRIKVKIFSRETPISEKKFLLLRNSLIILVQKTFCLKDSIWP